MYNAPKMGIPKFFGSWLRHLQSIFLNDPGRKAVEGILVDMNDILHKIAEATYAYGENATPAMMERVRNSSAQQLEVIYDNDLVKHLDSLLTQLKPRQYLILCVDGVAPVAKLNQQRARRYRGKGMAGPFDSTMLTPGTEFMARVDNSIRVWIDQHTRLPPVVIYSSYKVPGEGEHKMFRLLENAIKEGRIDEGSGYHLVTGMDSDLVMLTTVSPVDSLLLMRENRATRRYDYIDVAAFRQVLVGKMRAKGTSVEPSRLYRDFVVILFLIGNDFLPHLSAFHDVGASIEALIRCYVANGQYLTDEQGIIWSNMKGFLRYLAGIEMEMLKEQAAIEYTTDYSILLNHVQRRKLQATASRYEVTNFDFNAYRQAWYTRALPYSTDLATDGDSMCSQFMFQMEWVLGYYLRKDVSHILAYPYAFAPLIIDLYRVVSGFESMATPSIDPFAGFHNVMTRPGDTPPSIIVQLLSVIPPRMANLLPKPFNAWLGLGGYLFDLCPAQPRVYEDGKTEEWRFTVVMPLADFERVSNMAATVSVASWPDRVRLGEIYTRIRPRPPRTSSSMVPARVAREEDAPRVDRRARDSSASSREKEFKDPARRRAPRVEAVWTDRYLL